MEIIPTPSAFICTDFGYHGPFLYLITQIHKDLGIPGIYGAKTVTMVNDQGFTVTCEGKTAKHYLTAARGDYISAAISLYIYAFVNHIIKALAENSDNPASEGPDEIFATTGYGICLRLALARYKY
jgi:hypothetical protein